MPLWTMGNPEPSMCPADLACFGELSQCSLPSGLPLLLSALGPPSQVMCHLPCVCVDRRHSLLSDHLSTCGKIDPAKQCNRIERMLGHLKLHRATASRCSWQRWTPQTTLSSEPLPEREPARPDRRAHEPLLGGVPKFLVPGYIMPLRAHNRSGHKSATISRPP